MRKVFQVSNEIIAFFYFVQYSALLAIVAIECRKLRFFNVQNFLDIHTWDTDRARDICRLYLAGSYVVSSSQITHILDSFSPYGCDDDNDGTLTS